MPVAMTGGNHDRWGDTFWEQELGIRFSPDELRIPLAGGAALAVHGDGVAEARWHGRLLHSVFRHPVTSRSEERRVGTGAKEEGAGRSAKEQERADGAD